MYEKCDYLHESEEMWWEIKNVLLFPHFLMTVYSPIGICLNIIYYIYLDVTGNINFYNNYLEGQILHIKKHILVFNNSVNLKWNGVFGKNSQEESYWLSDSNVKMKTCDIIISLKYIWSKNTSFYYNKKL